MTRLLFLWDAEAFGGHDVSALVALECLVARPEFTVGALHTGRNARLTDELARIARTTGRLEVVCAAAAATASESIDGLLRGPRTRSLQKAVDAWRPDRAVNVQGFITLGLCALGACRASRIPVVSYVPMTHRVWALRRSPVSLLQDLVNHFWYSVPTAFITTSERMKEKLVRNHGVPAERAWVVEYGPDVTRIRPGNRVEARQRFGLPQDATVVGVLGRVEFRQKRQDFLVRTVASHREALRGFEFAIVGDGPDLDTTKTLADRLGVATLVRFLPWQSDLSTLYPALDAVLIPSRYEGVPLVMLEAMARHIPVLASDVDGMADFLPTACLFGMRDAEAMVAKLRALPGSPSQTILNGLASLVQTRLNAESFAARFADELVRFSKGAAP